MNQADRPAALDSVSAGLGAVAPFLPAIAVWGAAFGAGAAGVHLTALVATMMSAVVWSGTSQMAALPLLHGALANLFVISLLVSLRFVPMTLSITHQLGGLPAWRRGLLAGFVADAGFAAFQARKEAGPRFLIGTWLGQYVVWLVGTVAGLAAASALPPALTRATAAMVPILFAVMAVQAARAGRAALLTTIAAGLLAALALQVTGSGTAIALAAVLVATASGIRRA